MTYLDMHCHSKNSHDGKLAISELVRIAKEKKVKYLLISDHFDFDLDYGGARSVVPYSSIKPEKLYAEFKAAKAELEKDKNCDLHLLFGIEAAYSDSEKAIKKCQETLEKYPFDCVINSVHSVNGQETYFRNYFFFKSKQRAYGDYLDAVLRSLDAPYDYDVVAHIGYITHGAPYKDKTLRYADFADKFDAILKKIIEKGKALEINCHHDVNPPRDVIERYFALGGRKVTYGGDSHRGEIAARFEEVSAMLKDIGFEYYSVFENRKEILIRIE